MGTSCSKKKPDEEPYQETVSVKEDDPENHTTSLDEEFHVEPLRHPECMMDLSRFQSTAHGHDFGGLSRVVMVRKTDQRTFATKTGQEPKCEVVTRETIETFRGHRTERKVTTSEKRDIIKNLPADVIESINEPKTNSLKLNKKSSLNSLIETPTKLRNGHSASHLPSVNTDYFENECLKSHNDYRRIHGVPALQLCKALCKVSEEWANTLATKNQVESSNNKDYGENIHCTWSATPNILISGKEPVEKWYSEGKDYVFGKEPADSKSKHFTQVIWKDTKKFGVAYARSRTGKIYIVATYDPPGNISDQFHTNILPMGGVCKKQSKKYEFENDCLIAHNEYRALHGAPPLKLNKKMCRYSEEWAKVLATRGQMEHRKNSEYGENIFCKWSSAVTTNVTGKEVVSHWYDEMKDHQFGKEPSNLKTGHFTQVVWKDSEELGIAFAKNRNGHIFVVANYSPPGNFIGSFAINVAPVGGFRKSLSSVESTSPKDRASPNTSSFLNGSVDGASISSTSESDFTIIALKVHNEYRRKHGVPELTLSQELCTYAKQWADIIARDDRFQHRSDGAYGENIFALWSSDPNAKISARDVCKKWYDEIKEHQWSSEPRVLKSGHFTQMIWKTTKEMGIALAKGRKGKIFVVANYNPRGNIMGQFINNVPRAK